MLAVAVDAGVDAFKEVLVDAFEEVLVAAFEEVLVNAKAPRTGVYVDSIQMFVCMYVLYSVRENKALS